MAFRGGQSFYNPETEEVMSVPVQFQMPKMSFNEFKFGSTLTVDRGHGLKPAGKGSTAN
jgi:hypothetical protein